MVIESSFYERIKDARTSAEDIRKLTAVLTVHQIAIWEYDIQTNTCYFSNDYFRILGLDKIGVYFTDIEESYQFIHPEDLPRYKQFFEELLHTETESAQLSYRYLGVNGEIIWTEDHFLLHGKNGTLNEIIAYSINVTEKRKKERQIAHLADYNSKIIAALPDFMFIFDDDFHIIEVIKSPHSELLHPVDELRGVDARNIYSPEVSELYINSIRSTLLEQRVTEIEYALDAEGQTYYFQARLTPFSRTKVLALIHDISERVRRSKELIEAKRKAEEADRMKNIFLASMSHEIRTPLNAIIGFSEIVSLTDDPAEREDYLNIIHKNCGLLLQLIDDILDLSRIEAGKEEMHFETVNLAKLIRDVDAVQRLKIPAQIELRTEIPEELSIYSDGNRLVQIVSNFMSNAIKNTKEGSITLGYRREDNWVHLYVRDTGCGIPKEKLAIIFNRFEKLNEFTQGTGLGLPICKHIAERLGGKIEVSSEEGKGSTFAVRLHLSDMSLLNGTPEKRKKIIVAESSEKEFSNITSKLSKEYDLVWAKDGEDAIEHYLYEQADLLLVSMRLSKVSGTAVIERIRMIAPNTPIIAITEHAYYTEQQQAFHAGCSEIITKPYSLSRLKELIDGFLKNS
ncbi:MAG: response regulator [Prevotellaceae bacterium]|jgi:signal transduction histidine kinase/CheY-like chemotaxis protein|nr:response regulator [Prevotellaceae bacterium]